MVDIGVIILRAKGNINLIVVIVISLLSLVLILNIFFNYFSFLRDKNEEDICKSSIASHVLSRTISDSMAELNCPSKEILIKSDDSYTIKKTFADEMVRCWDQFYKGSPDLFSKEGTYCSVCSIIDFKKKNIIVDDFFDFYLNEPYKGMSYADYLAPDEAGNVRSYFDDEAIFSKIQSKMIINSSKKYSVVFSYSKGKDEIDEFMDVMGGRKDLSIFMGVGTMVGVGGAIAIGLFSAPVSIPFSLIIGISGGVGLVSGISAGVDTFFPDNPPSHFSFIVVKEHTPSDFSDLGCDFFPSVQKNINE